MYYLISCYPPKRGKKAKNKDFEVDDNPMNDDFPKHYKRTVHLAVLQSDDLNWLRTAIPNEQMEEMLDNLKVIAGTLFIGI